MSVLLFLILAFAEAVLVDGTDNHHTGGSGDIIIEMGKLGHNGWTRYKETTASSRSRSGTYANARDSISDEREFGNAGEGRGGGHVENSYKTSAALRMHAHDVAGLSVASEAVIAAILVLGVALIAVVLHAAGRASNKKIRETEDGVRQWLLDHPEDHVAIDAGYGSEMSV